MSREATRALLPAGLIDHLPPSADQAAGVVERLLACFSSHGYERVKPPMIEFEDTLLTGPAAPLADQTFRLMDPVSQRMMGLRADITMQVARIATTRLKKAPRPVRLAYAGDVFRVRGAQLRPERQFMQIGFELIGAPTVAADVEAMEAQRRRSAPVSAVHPVAQAIAGEAEEADPVATAVAQAPGSAKRPFKRTERKVGRNEPCPCGSGKKYKQCHGRIN